MVLEKMIKNIGRAMKAKREKVATKREKKEKVATNRVSVVTIKLKEHLNCWVVGLRLEDLESAKIVNFCDSSCTSVWGKVSSVVPAFLCQFLPTRRGGIYLSRNETSNYCAFHMLNVSLRATDFSAGQKARTHGAF